MAGIEIIGMDSLIRKLGSVAKAQDVVEPIIVEWSERIGEEWHTYPAQLPGQRYRRTGRLGRGKKYARTRTPTEVTATASNEGVPYNVWVLQDKTQARVHRGRWATDDGMVRSYGPQVVREAEAAIQRKLSE